MRGQLNQWRQIRFAELKEESNSEGTVPELSCKGQFNSGKPDGIILGRFSHDCESPQHFLVVFLLSTNSAV